MTPSRICSLLPSATEIVYALGLGDRLVGVTHECDFPPEAAEKPHVTSSVIDSTGMSSRQIDEAVRAGLAEQETIYHLDRDLLQRLQPDLVLTQDLCEVCAVGPEEVQSVLASLSVRPDTVSLEPHTLANVLDTITDVGALVGVHSRAVDLVEQLGRRMDAVRDAVRNEPVVSVLTLEWIDPLFVGGHWVPEMVEVAGGRDVLGRAGEPSRVVAWDDALAADPEVIVVMLCGFDLERSLEEMRRAALPPQWEQLRAVREGRVFVTDGSAYFSRPGPRLAGGVEILGHVLHPTAWDQSPADSWAPLPGETRS